MQLINESFKNHSELALKKFSQRLELFDFLLILRVPLLICGIFFNFVVVYVNMLRSRKAWKNISSVLVFHLSLIHVFLYFSFPIFLSYRSSAFSCTNKEFVKHMFLGAIFGTLAATAWDRYRNIALPFKSLAPCRLKTFFLLISGIWLFSLATTLPIFFTVQPRTEAFCQKEENKTAEKCYTFTYCYWPSNSILPKTLYFV